MVRGWVLDNLNISRLDNYYMFMAVLSLLNFLCFLVVAKLFVYNDDARENKSSLEMNPASSQNSARISKSTPQQYSNP